MKITHFRQIVFILINIYYCNNLFSQGSWSIKYLPIDSLDSSYTKKELRLDFKKSGSDTIYIRNSENLYRVRHLIHKKDTDLLNINDVLFPFMEDWIVYPDHGSIDEQKLKYIGKVEKYINSYIKEIFLIEIGKSNIIFEIYLYLGKKALLEKHKISIDKSAIKGFLFEK